MSSLEMYLRVGQTLYCNNGEKVTVKNIDYPSFTVEYKGKLYERPNNILGIKLHFNLASLNKKYVPVRVEVICEGCYEPFGIMIVPAYTDHEPYGGGHLCADCHGVICRCEDCGETLSDDDTFFVGDNQCLACYHCWSS